MLKTLLQMYSNSLVIKQKQTKYLYEHRVSKLNYKIEFFVPHIGHQNCLDKSLTTRKCYSHESVDSWILKKTVGASNLSVLSLCSFCLPMLWRFSTVSVSLLEYRGWMSANLPRTEFDFSLLSQCNFSLLDRGPAIAASEQV